LLARALAFPGDFVAIVIVAAFFVNGIRIGSGCLFSKVALNGLRTIDLHQPNESGEHRDVQLEARRTAEFLAVVPAGDRPRRCDRMTIG
jgi:hypothetical protein